MAHWVVCGHDMTYLPEQLLLDIRAEVLSCNLFFISLTLFPIQNPSPNDRVVINLSSGPEY